MMESAPLMSDPGRWRTMMYEAFWLGKEPTLTAEEQKRMAERKVEEARRSIGSPRTKGELDSMQALMERAKRLRGEQ